MKEAKNIIISILTELKITKVQWEVIEDIIDKKYDSIANETIIKENLNSNITLCSDGIKISSDIK